MTVAGRYTVERPIGKGSFGHTFLARDGEGGRAVAMKLLDQNADAKAEELFEREATVLRSMRHQGVPEVHDVVRDTWEGAPGTFLVMEYIEGPSLLDIIEEKRQLDPADVVHLFLELVTVLEYLHSRVPPVVHRDIKPANIILRRDGHAALVDFGSVRREFMAPDDAGSTIAGTYGYMPYEQYMGQATPASDLYSLGATFLHLLTGRQPRHFMNDEGRIQVPDALPGDPRLGPIVARLLRPSPTDRYASARDVRQAFLTPSSSPVLRSSSTTVVRNAVDLSSLGEVPRPMDKRMNDILDRISPGALEYLDSRAKPGDEAGIMDWLGLAFFSVVTLGVLPIVFVGMARQRRRRLKRFLREGMPAAGHVISIAEEKVAFDERIAKVTYRFEADGAEHRDADHVLPAVANRWQPGDRIQVLYLPEFDYDSVIVSAR